MEISDFKNSVQYTELQKLVHDKLVTAVDEVAIKVLTLLISTKNMDVNTFVDKYVTSKQEELSHLDDRTNKFFKKMMVAINDKIDSLPEIPASLILFQIAVGDQELREKFLKATALPTVKKLIEEFDEIKVFRGVQASIVNDINEGNATSDNIGPTQEVYYVEVVKENKSEKKSPLKSFFRTLLTPFRAFANGINHIIQWFLNKFR